MDVAALSISMNQESLGTQVGISVLKMAKDQAEQQGQALTQMMEQSVQPNLGRNFDIRV